MCLKEETNMTKKVLCLVAISVLALGLTPPAEAAVSASQPGQHTVTNGPISITVPAGPTFQRDSITGIDDTCTNGPAWDYTDASATLRWSAKSAAGPIVGYDIYDNTGEEGPVLVETISIPILTGGVGNNDGGCGGGAQSDAGVVIVAHDNAGNTVSVNVFYSLKVVRWNNTGTYGQPASGWTYSGAWAVSNCLCADGGSQTYTTTKNATATFTATGAVAGTRLALMMAEGPGRGSFKVYQDGVLTGTINTHTTSNANRVLTWTSAALTAGNHVFKVVNLASAGHPRLDVNAALATCPGVSSAGGC
jgi:hypothetical protein